MFDVIISSVFGLVQGLTEFLPVSSSGHLVLLHEFLPSPSVDELAYDLMLHTATLLAVCFYLRREIYSLAIGFFRRLAGKPDEAGNLSFLVIITTVPAALAGWLFEDWVESVLRSPLIVALMLAIVAFVLLWADRQERTGTISSLNKRKALGIGFAQALALVPGTSRSGITIAASLASGMSREAAVRYSFLASVPLIAGAFISKVPDLASASMPVSVLLAGFFSAAISAYLALGFLEKVARFGLRYFAYYRLALAALLLIFFLLR